MTQFAVFGAIGAAVIVEDDVEAREILSVRLLHLGDQFLLATAFLPGTNHDRGAVGIIGAQVDALMSAQLLEADPDVRLDVFDEVTDVDMPVRVGQCRGHQDPPLTHGRLRPTHSVALY